MAVIYIMYHSLYSENNECFIQNSRNFIMFQRKDLFHNARCLLKFTRFIVISLIMTWAAWAYSNDAPVTFKLLTTIGDAEVDVARNYSLHLPASSSRNSGFKFNPVPVQADKWYELTIDYGQDSSDSRLQTAKAMMSFEFHRGQESLKVLYAVPGLRVSTAGGFYRYIPSTYYLAHDPADPDHGRINFTFRVPSEATHLTATLRNWRNGKPMEFRPPQLKQVIYGPPVSTGTLFTSANIRQDIQAVNAQVLTDKELVLDRQHPFWRDMQVIPFYNYELQGVVESPQSDTNRALARIVFLDRDGKELAPPYEGLGLSEHIGAYRYLPSGPDGQGFSLGITAPPGAHTLRLGFQGWHNNNPLHLQPGVQLVTGPPLSLEKVLRACDLWGSFSNFDHPGLDDVEVAKQWLWRMIEIWGDSGEIALPATAESIAEQYIGSVSDRTFMPRINNQIDLLNANFQALLRQRELSILPFDPFILPERPGWDEDPYHSISWRQKYQSLYWLGGYRKESGELDLAAIEQYLDMWLANNTWPRLVDPYAYDDHGIAMRAEMVVNLIKDCPNLSQHSPQLAIKLVALAMQSGLLLDELLDNPAFRSHNHGLFHAHALLGLALALPTSPFAAEWHDRSLRRLNELVDILIDDNGFSIEQASSYHYMVMRILITIYESMRGSNAVPEPLIGKIENRIVATVRAAMLMTHPDGGLLRMGDSEDYADSRTELVDIILNRMASLSFGDEIDCFVENRPLQGYWVFPRSGYAVYKSFESPERNGYLFIDFSPQVFSHGHYDATSFEYSLDGQKWIVDSGGPYRYDASYNRHYLLQSRAHNVCLPNDREQTDGETWIVRELQHTDHYEIVLQSNTHGAQYRHLRRFLVLKDLRAIAITDIFEQEADASHLTGFLHFDPEVDIDFGSGDGEPIVQSKGRSLVVRSMRRENEPLQWEAVKGAGQIGFDLQGWIVRSSAYMESAPTLIYRVIGTELVDATIMLAEDNEALERIEHILEQALPLRE